MESQACVWLGVFDNDGFHVTLNQFDCVRVNVNLCTVAHKLLDSSINLCLVLGGVAFEIEGDDLGGGVGRGFLAYCKGWHGGQGEHNSHNDGKKGCFHVFSPFV